MERRTHDRKKIKAAEEKDKAGFFAFLDRSDNREKLLQAVFKQLLPHEATLLALKVEAVLKDGNAREVQEFLCDSEIQDVTDRIAAMWSEKFSKIFGSIRKVTILPEDNVQTYDTDLQLKLRATYGEIRIMSGSNAYARLRFVLGIIVDNVGKIIYCEDGQGNTQEFKDVKSLLRALNAGIEAGGPEILDIPPQTNP